MLYRYLTPQVQGVSGVYVGGLTSDIIYDFSRISGMLIVDSPVYNTVGGPLIPSTYYRTNTVLTYFYSIADTSLSPYYYHFVAPTTGFNRVTYPTGQTTSISAGVSAKVRGGKIDNSGINYVVTANTGITVASYSNSPAVNTSHVVAGTPTNMTNPISFTTDDAYFAGSTTYGITICKITPQVSPYITYIYTSVIGGTITDMVWIGDDLLVFSQISGITANVVVFTLNRTDNSVSIKVPNTSMVSPYPVYIPQVAKISENRFVLSSTYISGEINLMDFTYSNGTFTTKSVGGAVASNTTGGDLVSKTNYPYVAYPCLNRQSCVVRRPSKSPVVFDYIASSDTFSRSATTYPAMSGDKIFAHDSGKIFSSGSFYTL